MTASRLSRSQLFVRICIAAIVGAVGSCVVLILLVFVPAPWTEDSVQGRIYSLVTSPEGLLPMEYRYVPDEHPLAFIYVFWGATAVIVYLLNHWARTRRVRD
jgi:hypothetical protein